MQDNDVWEAIELLNGHIYIYRKGFKEEADFKDVFKYNPEIEVNRFTRFNNGPLKPAETSSFRLNRAVIASAWYLASDSEAVQELKKVFPDIVPVEQKV
jgi:hypothetical protein